MPFSQPVNGFLNQALADIENLKRSANNDDSRMLVYLEGFIKKSFDAGRMVRSGGGGGLKRKKTRKKKSKKKRTKRRRR